MCDREGPERMTAAEMTEWVDRNTSKTDGVLTAYAWKQIRRFEVNCSALSPAVEAMIEARQSDRADVEAVFYAISKLSLTQRDKAVLEQVAQTLNLSEIARRLQVDRRTALKHIVAVRDRLERIEGPYAGWLLCLLETILCKHLFKVEGLD